MAVLQNVPKSNVYITGCSRPTHLLRANRHVPGSRGNCRSPCGCRGRGSAGCGVGVPGPGPTAGSGGPCRPSGPRITAALITRLAELSVQLPGLPQLRPGLSPAGARRHVIPKIPNYSRPTKCSNPQNKPSLQLHNSTRDSSSIESNNNRKSRLVTVCIIICVYCILNTERMCFGACPGR